MAPKAMRGRPPKAMRGRPPASVKKAKAGAKSMKSPAKMPRVTNMEALKGLHGYIVNLERRPDRWQRVSKMLKKETPWLSFDQHKASDGSKMRITEDEIAIVWNGKRNAGFADFYEWVFDAPGTDMHEKFWKWNADANPEDDEWRFTEDGEPFDYVHDAPKFAEQPPRTGTVEKIATGEKFKVKLQFQQKTVQPGESLKMSGGERGCAHSHLRLWRIAAERKQPTLVLEDDAHLLFDRNCDLGRANGKVFTQRLALAMEHAPADFDVIYLGWSGWRGGHNFKAKPTEDPAATKYIRKVEYVWTTVAYVISQAGAKKLLAKAQPMDQPVDNFMAWEASQGRLNSYVCLDEGDDDGTWAGGIVDQFDFQGDTDIQKSDGGHQGDEATVAA
eukprot:TRINITY_DN23953_c0_g1_i1.p1 TRINITY_DN23953_c0_g1~~TRINITY_DN23953_c0_g1_i1.p1  ORF type:complete len:415 (+),score=106.52 TRINITY_DN23953_c0_g1_i1:82-1245(+)